MAPTTTPTVAPVVTLETATKAVKKAFSKVVAMPNQDNRKALEKAIEVYAAEFKKQI